MVVVCGSLLSGLLLLIGFTGVPFVRVSLCSDGEVMKERSKSLDLYYQPLIPRRNRKLSKPWGQGGTRVVIPDLPRSAQTFL